MMHSNLPYFPDTIFAPSTAIGGAISVIRISGPDASTVARTLLQKDLHPRVMTYGLLRFNGDLLDACMAVLFSAPNSYTGEDMLELHCHGGIQTFRNVSNALLNLQLRPAEGGEFTKRAFLNGKMDLTQAEAVMDLIQAQADASLKSALYQLNGGIGQRIAAIEDTLLQVAAGLEAAIDYPEEMEEDVLSTLPLQLAEVQNNIHVLLQNAKQGRFLREGIRVVILGRPNVGKSSLFNALLGEDRAIVTNLAGTTRDLLDERVSWDGISVRLMDTAGLRNAIDEAESIGIDRAKKALQNADLLLIVLDGSSPLTSEDITLLSETEKNPRIILSNKCDLGTVPADISVSCKTGEGIELLKQRIVALANPQQVDTCCVTNIRHIRALESAKAAIEQAMDQRDMDCIATEVREALHSLGTITGSDVDEALLDRIFERFCVGK